MKNNRLSDLDIQVIDGDRGVNYPKEKDFSEKGFCLFLNAKNVTNNGFKFDICQFISKERDLILGTGKLNRLDIVLTTRGTVGNIAFYDEKIPFEHIRINSGMVLLRNQDNNIDHKYLHHFLKSSFLKEQIERISFGSAQPQLTVKTINSIGISYPQQKETQRKIARILSTADAVIEKTEAAIAKYRAIKQGMLHDLFTRGIDVSTACPSERRGKLRPTYEDAPELYKESKLGWIPKEWEVERLDNYFGLLRSGLSRLLSEQDIGLPVLISGNIQENKIDFSCLRYWYENDPQGADTSAYVLQNGDILLCFINSIDQIGKVAIYEGYFRPCIYTTNLFRIKASEIVKPKFLYYLLSSNIVQNEIKAIVKPAVNQASFTTKDFCKIPVPIISDKEQNKISNNVEQIDTKIQTEQTYLHKLQQIKAGLMADLLSGKKNVETVETQNFASLPSPPLS
ncbi:MAG: restriction endonuclease subunit S [Candidatus Scalindua rubra]|uniref:Type-1 restriction enzyme EcoKI specificity protein n=1 Tax=Candidatus Scalindua brodae TaxID=237368 RepID=A0A0B0EJ41_9BACT|nr:MAG: Type-1 restriction enzyme EcoKI specificity protein [Candidatus Scalindua brodae]MBZ0107721.1 restriction endonuclease subunit S [Candidatus Scalindua rubra]TWU35521.1 Type-1 restriction enzyme EcoKI specificity protein [Candidatus Brocadiaceae bacterium S225]